MAIGGIDIGGTKIGACLGTRDGAVLRSHTAPFDTDSPPEDVLGHACDTLERLADEQGEPIESVGVACPGPFDNERNCFLHPPNLKHWHGFELGRWLSDRLGPRVRILNDANAAAVAEHLWGGHADARVLVFLTCSTGLGAGIIIDGVLFEGTRGMAGEVGRIQLAEDGPVGFGQPGTAEGFGSGTGLMQLAERERLRAVQSGETSGLTRVRGPIDARALCELAAADDLAALRAVRASAAGLGRLIAILANVLAPDRVVLGTIPAAYPDLFLPPLHTAVRAGTTEPMANAMTIVTTSMTDRWQRQALAAAVNQ